MNGDVLVDKGSLVCTLDLSRLRGGGDKDRPVGNISPVEVDVRVSGLEETFSGTIKLTSGNSLLGLGLFASRPLARPVDVGDTAGRGGNRPLREVIAACNRSLARDEAARHAQVRSI